ncbi:Ankyrin repeat domain-containing protein 1 [Colletotrichum siamense]|uniref:Ankyrin repeat domain-containing protein 1 n=1 Tax=Colletotrichum siamense TaxID=690259 RepID=A0A9P5ERL7_COLSI|nr:Ankyrin repeat domain-containing protein 1 [Colletotrichum siamense]KAF4858575.1 Ankyrin repeat domain-containing protein 1 [Colletotrichum siamense]
MEPFSSGSEPFLAVSVADFPMELIIMIFMRLGSRGADWANGYRKKETRGNDGRFHRFDIWRDMVNFAATCRRIHECITPMIYRLDNYAFHSSALLLSAKRGNVAGILKALEFGAQIDAPDCTELWVLDEKKTTRTSIALRLASLHWASYHRHLDAMDILLQHGASPNDVVPVKLPFPDTRLNCPASNAMKSAYKSHTRWDRFYSCERAETLLDEGANALYLTLLKSSSYSCNYYDRNEERSRARADAGTDAARLLIRAGASLITHTGLGLHALHQACCGYDFEMTRFLLEEVGADPKVKDPLGNTPMHYMALAVKSSYDPYQNDPYRNDVRQLIRLLLRYGADINAENAAGYTPLHSFLRSEWSRFSNAETEACFAFLDAGAYIISERLLDFYLSTSRRPLSEERKQIVLDAETKGQNIHLSRIDENDSETDETDSDFDEDDSDVDEDEVELSEEEAKAVNIQLCKLWCRKFGHQSEPTQIISSWSLGDWESYWDKARCIDSRRGGLLCTS